MIREFVRTLATLSQFLKSHPCIKTFDVISSFFVRNPRIQAIPMMKTFSVRCWTFLAFSLFSCWETLYELRPKKWIGPCIQWHCQWNFWSIGWFKFLRLCQSLSILVLVLRAGMVKKKTWKASKKTQGIIWKIQSLVSWNARMVV